MKVALYLRVSTSSQSVESQRHELLRVCEQRGYDIYKVYADEGVSGASSDRPALSQMLKDAAAAKFQMVLCWDISRLGRSLQHLVGILNDLQRMKVDLFFLQQSLDTSSHSGRMMFNIFGALAEYERSLIRERVASGLARAKAQGTKLGRPTKLNDSVKAAVVCLRQKGMSIRKIAAQLEVGVGTCYNILKAA